MCACASSDVHQIIRLARHKRCPFFFFFLFLFPFTFEPSEPPWHLLFLFLLTSLFFLSLSFCFYGVLARDCHSFFFFHLFLSLSLSLSLLSLTPPHFLFSTAFFEECVSLCFSFLRNLQSVYETVQVPAAKPLLLLPLLWWKSGSEMLSVVLCFFSFFTCAHLIRQGPPPSLVFSFLKRRKIVVFMKQLVELMTWGERFKKPSCEYVFVSVLQIAKVFSVPFLVCAVRRQLVPSFDFFFASSPTF